MGTGTGPETNQDRRDLVADAGFGPLSAVSAVAGAMTAVGVFAATVAGAVAFARRAGRSAALEQRWQVVDDGEGLVLAAALLASFLVGGYAAGRMARRAGVLHGAVMFVVGFAAAAATVALLGPALTAVAVLAGTAAMLVGSLAGGAMGEKWHEKLVNRALDPGIGAEAEAYRAAEARAAEAERLRTSSFRRARRATPTRTRRVDREAVRGPEGEEQPARRSRIRVFDRPGARTG